MALTLLINVSVTKCNQITITDVTPTNDDDNTYPNGWDGSIDDSVAFEDISEYSVEITSPSGDTYDLELTLQDGQYIGTTPINQFGNELKSGIWSFLPAVTDDDDTIFTNYTEELIYCAEQCKIKKLFSKFTSDQICSKCSNNNLNRAIEGFALYKALESAALEGNRAAVNQNIELINKLLTFNNCKC